MSVETPASRRDDPETSHEAEAENTASGRRKAQQLAAANAVRRYPGRPSSELARLTGLDRHMLGRRLPEIEAGEGPGMVIRIGTAKDSQTGRRGGRWFSLGIGASMLADKVLEEQESIAKIRENYGDWLAACVTNELLRMKP